MPVQRFSYSRVSALLVSTLIVLYVTRRHQLQDEQSQLFGRYNMRQILARTRLLCPLLTNEENVLHLTAAKQELQGETNRRYWIVDCTDAMGNYLACFTWEAESGELYLVGHRSSMPLEQQGAPLSREEAVRIAQRWMRDLGMAGQASAWRLASAQKPSHDLWHVTWEAGERAAYIQIGLHSGDLIQAKSWRQRGRGRAWTQ